MKKPDLDLVIMLTTCRPNNSKTLTDFCEHYIEPFMGFPDTDGNYIHIEGPANPAVAFMAHHDTVHNQEGFQKLHIDADGFVGLHKKSSSNCLGADCTTGVWLILNMIKNKIPGLYIIHADEEIGCQGSRALTRRTPQFLDSVQAAISFDRRGTDSIVTHQMGLRTASDEFADSLARVLDDPILQPDSTGSYTDSNEYTHLIRECTNLSVGYYGQHTRDECQDLVYAADLLDRILDADWSKLEIHREPDALYTRQSGSLMAEIVSDYPDEVAELLRDMGWDSASLLEEFRAAPTNRDLSRMAEEEAGAFRLY